MRVGKHGTNLGHEYGRFRFNWRVRLVRSFPIVDAALARIDGSGSMDVSLRFRGVGLFKPNFCKTIGGASSFKVYSMIRHA